MIKKSFLFFLNRILHLYYENRLRNLNQWYYLVNYLKITNFGMLRPILLASLTIGIPDYNFILSGKDLYLNKLEPSSLVDNKKKSTTTTTTHLVVVDTSQQTTTRSNNSSSKQLNTSNLMASGILNDDRRNQPRQSSVARPQSNLTMNTLNSAKNDSTAANNNRTIHIDLTEIYEPYIDNLLDLDAKHDSSKYEFGDSRNTLMLSRSLILIDLIKSLEDKHFIELHEINILKLICDFIEKVRIILLFFYD